MGLTCRRFEGFSEQTAQHIDEEVRQILDDAYRRAKQIVIKRQSKLEILAEALLEHETIDCPQFEALMA